MATLTYVYSDQTAVLGPLATYAEPHAYDLCEAHSERLSAPRGWEVLRLAPDPDALGPSDRRPAGARRRGPRGGPPGAGRAVAPGAVPRSDRRRREVGRRGHLRGAARTPDGRERRPARVCGPCPRTSPASLSAVFKAYDVRGTVPDQIDEDLARARRRRVRRR